MEEEAVLKKEHRDALFQKLREDPKFREVLKKDWRAALKQMKIDPDMVAKGKLSRQDTLSFAGARMVSDIIIIIEEVLENRERISLSETVNFEARK